MTKKVVEKDGSHRREETDGLLQETYGVPGGGFFDTSKNRYEIVFVK